MVDSESLTSAEYWDRQWSMFRDRAGWMRTHSRGRRLWLSLLRNLMDEGFQRDSRIEVLELGCAPGTRLLELHSLRPFHRYRGIDISRRGLEITRERLQAAGVEADLEVGDIRHARLSGADLVVSFGLAEHFTDLAVVMRFHRRFVKAGGRVAITIPNYRHPVVRLALRWFSPVTLATHRLESMSLTALQNALATAGFVHVKVGRSGLALLPSSNPRPGPLGAAYGIFARAWNVIAILLPQGFPWSSDLWATGTNPPDTDSGTEGASARRTA